MVQGIAGQRQSPSLDRVGEDHRRPSALGLRLGERGEDCREIVAAEIPDEPGQLRIADIGEQALDDVIASTGRGHQRLADRGRRHPKQALVLRVGHRVEPGA